MAEETKFSKEELDEIKNIQQKYLHIQNSLGQVSLARINFDRQLEELANTEAGLIKDFQDHRQTEQDFVDKITKKYGNGNLNLENGTFIPTEEKK